MTCPVVLPRSSKSAGEVCGRAIVGFVAPGEGRCAYHLTERERRRVLAERRAARDRLGWSDSDVDLFASDELGE